MSSESPQPSGPETPAPGVEVPDEVEPTDPAHRAALLVMVSAPILLGAAVFALLKYMTG